MYSEEGFIFFINQLYIDFLLIYWLCRPFSSEDIVLWLSFDNVKVFSFFNWWYRDYYFLLTISTCFLLLTILVYQFMTSTYPRTKKSSYSDDMTICFQRHGLWSNVLRNYRRGNLCSVFSCLSGHSFYSIFCHTHLPAFVIFECVLFIATTGGTGHVHSHGWRGSTFSLPQ